MPVIPTSVSLNNRRGRKRPASHFVLWSAVALLFLGALSTTVNATEDVASSESGEAEKVCLAGSTEGSCQAGVAPEDALIKWISAMENGSVASGKFRIERIGYDTPVFINEPKKVHGKHLLSNGIRLNPDLRFYATEDIPKGTVLMEIPEEAIIGGLFKLSNEALDIPKFLFELDEESDSTKNHIPSCRMVEEIVNEQEKGNSSTFQPYLQYIFGEGNPNGKQPSTWSEKGQFVFWGMMGSTGSVFVPRKSADKHKFHKVCAQYMRFSKTRGMIPIPKSDEGNKSLAIELQEKRWKLEKEAYSYFNKYAWGTSLIPLFDMIPHRNGLYKNIEAKIVEVESGESVGVVPRNERFEFLRLDKDVANENKSYKVVVYAHRDIKEKEALHASYNQCQNLGCETLQYQYTTGNLMADAGFLEQYPRRWSLEVDAFDVVTDSKIIFDIDKDIATAEKTMKIVRVSKMSPVDQVYGLNLVSAGIERWKNVEWEVDEHTAVMEKYEKEAIIAYRDAVEESFNMHWLHRNDPVVNEQTEYSSDGEHSKFYDDLDKPAGLAVHFRGEYMACAEGEVVDNGVSLAGAPVKGFYQELDYLYESDVDNTYMNMEGMLHSASNFRAHYHESSIHVPLQYVKDVKRVAYIGGGDNMVLHEVLKYPDLELVVGMELDQQASRSSLKYFGTTPAYFDPRVQWWYGNAANTLSVIPEKYFGTFDLVLVDLINDVSEFIKGAAGISLLEMAPLLMKQDGGVIARNEDFSERSDSSINMAKRVIVYDYYDTPRLCEICITIGSNSIDFANAERYEHGVDPILRLKPFNKTSHDGWSAYHDHSRDIKPSRNDTKWTAFDPLVCEKIERMLSEDKKQLSPGGGIFQVVEAENVTMEFKDGCNLEIQSLISGVATRNGLTVVGTVHQADIDPNVFCIILEEGYINTRVFPDSEYVAFDLMLWGSGTTLDKSEAIEKDLVSVVGGGKTKDSVTSFRVTAGGMAMAGKEATSNGLVERAREYYCLGLSDISDGDDKTLLQPTEKNENTEGKFDQSITIPKILMGSMDQSRKSDTQATFAVFCGKDGADECTSYDSIKGDEYMMLHPVYSCDSFDDMDGCKLSTEKRLLDIVADQKRFDGLILDESMSLDMGKIVHKLFNSTSNQARLLEKSFTVLSPIPPEEGWRRILIDRFRTEIIIVTPVTTAEIEIYGAERSEEWMMVSVQNKNFFAGIERVLSIIAEQTGLMTRLKRALPGSKPLTFDWNPQTKPTDTDYFNLEAENQWLGQKPIAYQHLMQMALGSIKASVAVNETVLVAKPEYDSSWSKEEFVTAKVIDIKDDKYVVEMMTHVTPDGKTVVSAPRTDPVGRDLIRKISPTEADRKYSLGDRVLIQCTDDENPYEYYASYITAFQETGLVDIRSADGPALYFQAGISTDRILVFDESPEFINAAGSLSGQKLENALEEAAVEVGFADEDAYLQPYTIGMGTVVLIVSKKGSILLKWDGSNGVEVNLFSYEQHDVNEFKAAFLRQFEHLSVIAQDAFPRGYGRVVNFEHEIKGYNPHWIQSLANHEDEIEIEYVDDDDYLDEEDEDEE